MFTLKIETDNDEFQGEDSAYNLSDLIHDVAHKIEDGRVGGKVLDKNGNTVGSFKLTK